MGCQGGYLSKAWDYMMTEGVVEEDCIPYASGSGMSGNCPSGCTGEGSSTRYFSTKYKLFTNVDAIKAEISTNGPIEVAFSVYNDFFSYSKGIYVHKKGAYAGGHAVKMIGWGIERGLEFWICSNSWNTTWGEEGYFRIAFG